MLNVPHVQLEPLFPRERVAPVDLRPAGDPRTHVVTPRLTRRVEGQIFHQQRPRTHETHVAPQDVVELRQLVEAGRTQPTPEGRHALGVARQRFTRTRLAHRSELVEHERTATETRASLTEDHRATQRNTDDHRQNEHGHCQHEQREQRDRYVENPLHDLAAASSTSPKRSAKRSRSKSSAANRKARTRTAASQASSFNLE